jgi:phospholipid/cholesterol/gamma-HCH transport system substrate-binding protein
MRDVSTEIKVGGVIILAIVILLCTIIWVKEYRFNVDHYEITGIFPQVGNLDVGDPVAVLGVDKGEVKEINLEDNNVRVTMSLTSDVQLKEDADAVIMNVGLMGERFIMIRPGMSDEPFDLYHPLNGDYDTGIPEVMGMMGEMIDQVRTLVNQLEGTIGEQGKAEQIRQLIDDLHQLTKTTNEFFQTNSQTMSSAVDDFSAAAGSLRGFLDSNKVGIDSAMMNFTAASADFKELSRQLNELSERISRGEGTIGKTMADDSLYYDLRRTLNNLDSLVTDFKQHPKKYVKVSIF